MATDKDKKEPDGSPKPPAPSAATFPLPGYNGEASLPSASVSWNQAPGVAPPEPPQEGPLPQKPGNLTVVIGRTKEYKSLSDAYILWFPLGLLGFHHFYLRRYVMGFLYFFTAGLCGIGWIVDGFRMPDLVKAANRKIDHPDEFQPLTKTEAYLAWFPFGLIGAHHFYLRRPAWGVAYTLTAGLFGIGWIVDAFRIPSLVRDANERLERELREPRPKTVSLCDAYLLGATPLGLLGAHHFYMGRHGFGLFYLLTGGGCGIGWITDWFRMKSLVERTNNPTTHPLGNRYKYLDDAYVLAFPMGLLGVHHFYLERPGWGVLYFFTGGLAGVGWLIDLCRMPCLVRETNQRLEEDLNVIEEIRGQIGSAHCAIVTRDINVNPAGSGQPNSMSSYGSLGETPFMAPPPYDATMAGYSSQGHVYSMPLPPYMGMPSPASAQTGPTDIAKVPYPELPKAHDNGGFRGDQA